jgi:serine/threonine protein kinase
MHLDHNREYVIIRNESIHCAISDSKHGSASYVFSGAPSSAHSSPPTSTVAYAIAACAGVGIVITVVVLVARRCRRRYQPVVARDVTRKTSKPASNAAPKQPLQQQYHHHYHHHQQQQHVLPPYIGKSDHIDRQLHEQTTMLLPSTTMTSPSPAAPLLFPPPSSSASGLIEIHPSSVRIVQRIGDGSFGAVYIGEVAMSSVIAADDRQPSVVIRPVIVKTLSTTASGGGLALDHQVRTYFAERTRSATGLRHTNVLAVVGACLQSAAVTGSGTMMSALYEHYDGVDLHSFLRRRGSGANATSTLTLLRLAEGVATGLEYAVSRGWIHGDVAGHNVLVAASATGGFPSSLPLAKICDLGLKSPWCSMIGPSPLGVSLLPPPPCCQVAGERSSNTPAVVSMVASSFPVGRLVAPEVIVYGPLAAGEPSDVWSYGILLWEMYSVRTAFNAVADEDDEDSEIGEPQSRNRIADRNSLPAPFDSDTLFVCPGSLPIRCPASIAAIISDCWNESPALRPSFTAIRCTVADLLDAVTASGQSRRGTGFACPGQLPIGTVNLDNNRSSPTLPVTNSSNSPATTNETACTTLTAATTTPMMNTRSRQHPSHHLYQQQQQQPPPQQQQWPGMAVDHEDIVSGCHRGAAFQGGPVVAGASTYWSSSDNNSSIAGDCQQQPQQQRTCPTPALTLDRSAGHRHLNYSNVV